MATDGDETESRRGYVLFTGGITDPESYREEYAPIAGETVERHGGRALVGGPDGEVLEGEWDHDTTVVLEFPSVEDAQVWYEDEDYRAAKEIRRDATAYGNLVIVPGVPAEEPEG